MVGLVVLVVAWATIKVSTPLRQWDARLLIPPVPLTLRHAATCARRSHSWVRRRMAPPRAALLLLLSCLASRAVAQTCNVPTCASDLSALTARMVAQEQVVAQFVAGGLTTQYSAAGVCTLARSSAALQALINTKPASIVLCPSKVLVSATLTIGTSLNVSCLAVTTPPSCILDGQGAVEVMFVSGGGVTVGLTGLALTARPQPAGQSACLRLSLRRIRTGALILVVDYLSLPEQPSGHGRPSSTTTRLQVCARDAPLQCVSASHPCCCRTEEAVCT